MVQDILKFALAIIIVGGTVAAVFVKPEAVQLLSPISTLIIGYFFGENSAKMGAMMKAMGKGSRK